MLQTGFGAMMGVRIYGADPAVFERIGLEMEGILRQVPGATDVVADRIVGKPNLEYEIDREAVARYGVDIRDAQDVIEVASVGGMAIQLVTLFIAPCIHCSVKEVGFRWQNSLRRPP